MKKILHITTVLLVSASIFAQNPTPPPAIMSNHGLLKVAIVNTNDSATVFVGGTFKAKDASAIDLDGKMIITGNFVQNATRPAFVSEEYDANNTEINDKVSTGDFIFRSDFANDKRVHEITTEDVAADHDRGTQYLSFPNIKFDTNDTIVVTSYMGIDAKTIDTINGKTGRLLLRSENIDGKIYDASLRFPYDDTRVPAGKIAIERNVELYRSFQNNQITAFASPFTNQRSGYFAGNWLRNPIISSNGYVLYPLANAVDGNGRIYPEYYVVDPFEQLLPGQPYLVRYQNDYDYDPEHDLLWTSDPGGSTAAQSTTSTYLFNGYPYNLSSIRGYIPEQILTDEVLYSHNLPAQTAATAKNIVVGNSYSAPISVEKLVQHLLNSGIQFSKYLYFFPAGSQTYMPMDMSADVNAFEIQHIPSQSIFMVKQTGRGGQLTFDKSLTVHAKTTNNLVEEEGTYRAPSVTRGTGNDFKPNLLRLKVSPADNHNVYDLAAVFVRTDASAGTDRYDMQKYFNPDDGSFQLSMRDDANTRQFQMGVPTNTASANMSFRPAKYAGNYILTVSNVESMTTQAVVLEDTKTNIFQDLRENPVYEFETDRYDNENRFVVHFLPQSPTGNPELTEGVINAYYNNSHSIIVHRLNEKDINSTIEVIDVQGRVVAKETVTSYPVQNVDATLASGVYIVRVKGARDYTGKIVIK